MVAQQIIPSSFTYSKPPLDEPASFKSLTEPVTTYSVYGILEWSTCAWEPPEQPPHSRSDTWAVLFSLQEPLQTSLYKKRQLGVFTVPIVSPSRLKINKSVAFPEFKPI